MFEGDEEPTVDYIAISDEVGEMLGTPIKLILKDRDEAQESAAHYLIRIRKANSWTLLKRIKFLFGRLKA